MFGGEDLYFVTKKEKTWYIALAESGSQIKYSPVSPAFGGLDGRWLGWRGIQKPIPTAIRTFSTWNAMPTACGSTIIGRSRRTSGIPRTSLSSVFESIFFPRL